MRHLVSNHPNALPYTARCGTLLGGLDDAVQPRKVPKLVVGNDRRPHSFILVRQYEEPSDCPTCLALQAQARAKAPAAKELRRALLANLGAQRRGPSGRMYSDAPRPSGSGRKFIGRV